MYFSGGFQIPYGSGKLEFAFEKSIGEFRVAISGGAVEITDFAGTTVVIMTVDSEMEVFIFSRLSAEIFQIL